jgi:hypothetical protein
MLTLAVDESGCRQSRRFYVLYVGFVMFRHSMKECTANEA